MPETTWCIIGIPPVTAHSMTRHSEATLQDQDPSTAIVITGITTHQYKNKLLPTSGSTRTMHYPINDGAGETFTDLHRHILKK
jgi:hypothetical protein